MRETKELKEIVTSKGVREGLKFLSALTEHRFSAIYRFNGESLKNLVLFDRENPERVTMPEIPVLASYCVYVRDTARRFCVENSMLDRRVENHPKRLEVIAYIGVPLLNEGERCLAQFVISTLCLEHRKIKTLN